MTIALMESAIDSVKDYLNTNMPAKLDALDAEYDDGIALVDIKAYYKAEVLALPEYPAIFVLGDWTDITADGPTHMQAPHHISVIILMGDQDTEILRKRLYRYVRAIVEVLRAGRATGSIGHAMVFDRLEYSPMYGQSGTALQDAKVELTLTIIETA